MATAFQNCSVRQLRDLAKASWDSVDDLGAIVSELSRRRTKVAAALRSRLQDRMAALKGNGKAVDGHAGTREVASDLSVLKAEVKKLKAEVFASRKETLRLQVENIRLTTLLGHHGPNASIYAQVGAVEGISDFALKGLRNAYRKEYHPDLKPDGAKGASAVFFKHYEALFDRIDLLRQGRR